MNSKNPLDGVQLTLASSGWGINKQLERGADAGCAQRVAHTRYPTQSSLRSEAASGGFMQYQ